MLIALAAFSAPIHPACAYPEKKKPQRCANSGLGHVENLLPSRILNGMKIHFPGRGGNLHCDLPLFCFAASMADTRRLSYPERRARIYLPGRPDSTVRLYAQLAGFRTEG